MQWLNQQRPVIGFLNSGSPDAYPDRVIAFHQGLRQLGYIEGENVVVDYRWALGEYDRLPAFAAELVKRRVSVLVATGGEPAALAAKSATSTIPIVFAIGGDPVKLGLVATYNRPGGNATGANILAAEMDGKRVALLHEMMPKVAHVGLLLDPNFPAYATQLNELQQAAAIIKLQPEILRAGTDGEMEAVFEIAPGNAWKRWYWRRPHFSTLDVTNLLLWRPVMHCRPSTIFANLLRQAA